MEDSKLLVLRYFDFVPFVDNKNGVYYPPLGYEYLLYFQNKDERVCLDEKFALSEQIMQDSGGIHVFKVPDKVIHDNNFILAVDVIKDDKRQNLMIEPAFDLVMSNDAERGVVMYSGEEKDIVAYVYLKNMSSSDHKVYLYNEEQDDQKNSPIVARFKEREGTAEDGYIAATILATDLENVADRLYNPVDHKYYGPNEVGKTLPWNQYYGNFLTMTLRNSQNEVIASVNIPVRVIHKVVPDPSTIPLEKINWNDHIIPLFEYYIRYYPWLHVKFNKDLNRYGKKFDLRVQLKVRNMLTDVIDRLEMKSTAEKKMPRSRDFPKGGLELMKRWRESLL